MPKFLVTEPEESYGEFFELFLGLVGVLLN